jgi:uncharacterized protein
MDETESAATTRIALIFEGGMGVAALLIGWLVGQSPLVGMAGENSLPVQVRAIGWGLMATGPMIVALVLIDRFPVGPLRALRDLADRLILRMFGGASLTQLAAVAITAGLGEELLFRGLIQHGLSRGIGEPAGAWAALVLASALFGAFHWLNSTYAFLAMLAGAYFGLLLILTESLWVPIVAHATYDFVALVYLVQPKRVL